MKHLVWSALEDVRQFPDVKAGLKEVSPGHLVAHFESKAEVTVSWELEVAVEGVRRSHQ